MFEQSPRRERQRGGRGLPWREHKGMVPRMHRAPLSGLLHVVFRETPSEWWQPRQGRGGPGQSCLPVRGGFSSPSPPRLQETDLAQFSKAMCTPVRASWALRRHVTAPWPAVCGASRPPHPTDVHRASGLLQRVPEKPRAAGGSLGRSKMPRPALQLHREGDAFLRKACIVGGRASVPVPEGRHTSGQVASVLKPSLVIHC